MSEQLSQRVSVYTHVGYRRNLSGTHTGGLYGHGEYRGRSHALTGDSNIYSGAGYKGLCGASVTADHDGHGFNVAAAPDEIGKGVTCRRCLRVIRGGRRVTA
jgi:hypothetical protein